MYPPPEEEAAPQRPRPTSVPRVGLAASEEPLIVDLREEEARARDETQTVAGETAAMPWTADMQEKGTPGGLGGIRNQTECTELVRTGAAAISLLRRTAMAMANRESQG